MELHPGSDRRAGVDFCIILTDEHGRIIGRIPGEVKGLIELKHVTQLSVYTGKSCAVDAYQNRVGVGLLVDASLYRITFTPYNFNNQLVPLTFISPNITWQQPNVSETAVSTEGLLLLSTMFLYQYSCHSSTYRSLHCSP